MTPAVIDELERGLRAAHDFNQFLWDTIGLDPDAPDCKVAIEARDDIAETLTALMNASRDSVALALETLEMVKAGQLQPAICTNRKP